MAYRKRKVTRFSGWISSYEAMRNLYNSVKPIRERAGNLRPIGNRRHQDELIAQNTLPDGTVVYSAVFRNTRVVDFLPDNSLLMYGGAAFGEKADFIYSHTPLYVSYAYKNLWVRIKDNVVVPLPTTSAINIETYPHLLLTPVNASEAYPIYTTPRPIIMQQRVIDRVKMKEQRTKFAPFLQYVKNMVAMSDGWLMLTTRIELYKQFHEHPDFAPFNKQFSVYDYNNFTERAIEYMFRHDMQDAETYPYLLFCLTHHAHYSESRMSLHVPPPPPTANGDFWRFSTEFKYDRRIHPTLIHDMTKRLITRLTDVHTTKEREPQLKPIKDIVGVRFA